MFDDELSHYRSLSNEELLEKAKMNDWKAVAVLLERIMEAT